MMDKASKILNKIKQGDIKPRPAWYFKGKTVLIWLAYILSTVLGALAFSVVLFAVQQTEFSILNHVSHSKKELFLGLLPFFWIVVLVVFLVSAIFGIRSSKKGYKFPLMKLVSINILLSILLGTLFFISGGAGRLENAFAVHVNVYNSIQEKKMKMWMMPQEGYLAGNISKASGDVVWIKDFDGKTWQVLYDSAYIPAALTLEKEEQVKIIGKIQEDGVFQAEEFRPWGGRQRRMRHQGGKK